MSVVLCILDGFGIGKEDQYNAVYCSKTRFLGDMMSLCPSSKLNASGVHVGLMDGQVGNSEIGHLTIGSGRIIENDLLRINKLMSCLGQHNALSGFVKNLLTSGGRCHIIGLLSDGGVHSHCDQIYKLVDYILSVGINPVLHVVADGRDVPPNSVCDYLKESYIPFVSTVLGRYYAMDRDKRWERTQVAYDLIINGVGVYYKSVKECIDVHYAKSISDEFILPSIIGAGGHGVHQKDGIIIANFRADRMRQLTSYIVQKAEFCDIMSLTKYSDSLNIKNFIDPIYIDNPLGQVIADSGLAQLRIAETEKYAHVTYFFNGRVEEQMSGEERILIDSPKVTTYDLCPGMSAELITATLISAIQSKKFDFILVNYANADMLGHTGNMQAAIKAIEVLDDCILKVIGIIKKTDDVLIITSDHGNVEFMYNHSTGVRHTAHTLNPVPFVILGKNGVKKVHDGNLYDIAPTVLSMMKLSVPSEMNGSNLLEYL